MKSAKEVGVLSTEAHQLSQGIKLNRALKLYLPLIIQVTFQTFSLIFFFLHLHIENTLLKILKKKKLLQNIYLVKSKSYKNSIAK